MWPENTLSKMATYRRIDFNRIKKWALTGSAVGIPLFLIFGYLVLLGDINIQSHSGDSICDGTIQDPCYAYINFTMQKDYIYLYPNESWSFYTEQPIKEIYLEVRDKRTSSGWRRVDLTRACSWLSEDTKCNYKYSYRFYKTKGLWEIRFVGYKYDKSDVVKWGFSEIDPVWESKIGNKIEVNYNG